MTKPSKNAFKFNITNSKSGFQKKANPVAFKKAKGKEIQEEHHQKAEKGKQLEENSDAFQSSSQEEPHFVFRKEDIIKKLRQKAAFKNPDEFNFKMINSKIVDGVHKQKEEINKFTAEELRVMKTQDVSYVLHEWLFEKKKLEKLTASLHFTDAPRSNKHIYFVENREEAKELELQNSRKRDIISTQNIPKDIQKSLDRSYKELEARKCRAKELEKLYLDMSLNRELQKKGRKRKLRDHEILNPNGKPVFKRRADRKR